MAAPDVHTLLERIHKLEQRMAFYTGGGVVLSILGQSLFRQMLGGG